MPFVNQGWSLLAKILMYVSWSTEPVLIASKGPKPPPQKHLKTIALPLLHLAVGTIYSFLENDSWIDSPRTYTDVYNKPFTPYSFTFLLASLLLIPKDAF